MSQYAVRDVTDAPEKLVIDGDYVLGCFNTPVKQANLLDVKSFTNYPVPRALKFIQLREWQAFQIKNEEYFVMIAIYNAKKISLVQFIVYNLKTKEKVKYEKKCMSWNLDIPDTLYSSSASYASDNFTIKVLHDLTTHKLEIDVHIEGFEGLPFVQANFSGEHDTQRYKPMVVCNPFSSESVMYSHKCLMPAQGSLTLGEQAITFGAGETQLIIDDHKGYYPYITTYDWVTGLGTTPDNKLIGFNLTNNQVIQQDKYNENCLWLDGELYPLPPITINRPNGHTDTWHINDEHDMVQLEFTPVTHTSVHVNYFVICSEYEGPYGYYQGTIVFSVAPHIFWICIGTPADRSHSHFCSFPLLFTMTRLHPQDVRGREGADREHVRHGRGLLSESVE